MMNRKIIVVPCVEKNWAYWSAVRIVGPGSASSARMNIARMPANVNEMNEKTRYRIPISLWFVVVIQ